MDKTIEVEKLHNKPGLTGEVVGVSMTKTVKVKVTHLFRHPLYRKAVKRSKIFLAHSEEPLAVGDKVQIAETRPISKNKHFKVVGKI